MKHYYIILILSVLTISATYAQADKTKTTEKAADSTKAWKFDGVIGLNAGATNLFFWSAGGNNNANALTFAKLRLQYQKDAIAWETNFDTDFGLTWVDQEDDQLKKTSDDIKFNTKLGWKIKDNLYLTASGSFKSQYAIGRKYKKGQYDPVISKWLSPSNTELSLGLDWKKSIGSCDFSVYVSPLAGALITAYVNDADNRKYTEEYLAAMEAAGEPVPEEYVDFRREMQTKYGTYKVILTDDGIPVVDWRSCRAELGLSLKGTVDYKHKNLTISSSIWLYTPYQGKGFDIKEAYEQAHPGETYNMYYQYSNLNRRFGNFDVEWDFLISYQFLKVLNVTLSTNLKYYNGILVKDKQGVEKERVQFKSVFGIGIGYSF